MGISFRVYLAGAITGLTPEQAKTWRNYVKRQLPGIQFFDPLRSEPEMGGIYRQSNGDAKYGTTKAIFSKNFFDIMHCDIMLAYLPKELPNPSYGTIWEIGVAVGLRKQIILVSDDKTLVEHPDIKESCGWILDNLDDAIEVISSLVI